MTLPEKAIIIDLLDREGRTLLDEFVSSMDTADIVDALCNSGWDVELLDKFVKEKPAEFKRPMRTPLRLRQPYSCYEAKVDAWDRTRDLQAQMQRSNAV